MFAAMSQMNPAYILGSVQSKEEFREFVVCYDFMTGNSLKSWLLKTTFSFITHISSPLLQ
jgi:hypothetical protein